MKNKNLALVAVLFTISVIMAFANGPTPQVVIDTDQIVDGAVTAIKTDGTLMLTDGSNADDPVTFPNASFTGDIDVTGDVGAATVNGVAPLTAEERVRSLVGSSTQDFLAQNIDASGEVKIASSTDAGDYKLQVFGKQYASAGNSVIVTTEVTLADDATADVATVLGASTRTHGNITVTSVSSNYTICARITGTANYAAILYSVNGSITDQDAYICVFPAGAGAYTIKNRSGAPATFAISYTGSK